MGKLAEQRRALCLSILADSVEEPIGKTWCRAAVRREWQCLLSGMPEEYKFLECFEVLGAIIKINRAESSYWTDYFEQRPGRTHGRTSAVYCVVDETKLRHVLENPPRIASPVTWLEQLRKQAPRPTRALFYRALHDMKRVIRAADDPNPFIAHVMRELADLADKRPPKRPQKAKKRPLDKNKGGML